MTTARLITRAQPGQGVIREHAKRLRAEGRSLIYVTIMRRADDIRPHLGAGPDMFFVDATGFGPPGIAFGPDVFYVDSPVKLEKIAMVIRRLCKRFTNPHVLIDCINGLVDVNGPEPTIEYVHYLVNQSAQDGANIDLVVDATRGGWVNKLRHIVDGVVATEAA